MDALTPDDDPIALPLAALVRRLWPDATGVSGLRRLTGGASLATWSLDAVRAGGALPLILRRRGGDAEVMSTSLPLATEAALLRAAAAAGVPVPAVEHLCVRGDGLGEAYLMRRVVGETLGGRIARDAAFAPARALLGRQCGAALARIHALPVDPTLALAEMDALAVLDRYEAIWRDGGARRPAIEAAFRWLRATAPAPGPAVLLHGDFRNGNLMVDADRGLVAILDWELAHVGDPAEDLGWLCVNSWRFGQVGRVVGGFADLDALLAGYREAGGASLDVARIRYWQALGTLKWAVITDMMYRSFADGSNRAVERAVIGRRLSECEVDLVALMRSGL